MDDFHVRSQFHEIISNPRFSTFRRLSPKPTSFHTAAQQASDIHEKSATYDTLPTPGLPDMAHFSNIRAEDGRQRVAVRYQQGKPLLHLRFSTLDMPSPATIVEEIKSRPQSEWEIPQPSFHQPLNSVFRDSSDSVSSFFVPFELVTAPRRMLSQRSARAQLCQAALPATSGESPNPDSTTAVEPPDVSRVQSMKSIPDSLQAVQDLAGQFPGTPMSFKDENTFPMPSVVPTEALPIPQALGSPSELQFKGPSSHEGFVLSDDSEWSSNRSSPVALPDNKSLRSTRQPTLYNVTGTPLRSVSLYHEKPFDPFNDDDEEDSVSSSRAAIVKTMSRSVNRSQDVEAGTGDLTTVLNTGKSRQSQSRKLRSPKAISKNDIPLSKVRSVGEDSRESTSELSSPRHASYKRGTVQLQDIIIPPRRSDMPEILDEYAESISTGSDGRH